jgi:formylglycine-generating enzyme required for sulfatase activity
MTAATERINDFIRRYGDEAIVFAYHAAFPLALTTELCYGLRERFAAADGWWLAPELLSSDLCERVRHDLYVMNGEVRLELLAALVEEFEAERLDEIAAFMGEYLRSALALNQDLPMRVVGGSPELVKYFALCLLRPWDALTAEIKRELGRILKELPNPQDRFELARLVAGQTDFLQEHGFEVLSLGELRSIARLISEDQPLEEIDRLQAALVQAGFPALEVGTVEMAMVELREDAVAMGDALDTFGFEVVQVNDRGKIITRLNQEAQAFREPLGDGLGLEMVAIPSGEFMMGSPETEAGRWDDEGPQHRVQVPPFFLGRYPVTQAQWRAVAAMEDLRDALDLKLEPARFTGDQRPVEKVTWAEAQEFCRRLSSHSGRNYRLPSEAEWEYACRAGTTTPYYFGPQITTNLVNCDSSRKATNNVGELPPNSFGLYDMHGNVWEWCLDDWHDNYENDLNTSGRAKPNDGSAWIDGSSPYKVMRGGSWDINPRNCRSATRFNGNLGFSHIGFRVMCETPRTW